MLQRKAISLTEDLPITEYPDTFSDGCLRRWEKGDEIKQLTIYGEKLPAETNVVGDFTRRCRKLRDEESYSVDQIYNCDEKGFNYKMMLSKTLPSRS